MRLPTFAYGLKTMSTYVQKVKIQYVFKTHYLHIIIIEPLLPPHNPSSHSAVSGQDVMTVMLPNTGHLNVIDSTLRV